MLSPAQKVIPRVVVVAAAVASVVAAAAVAAVIAAPAVVVAAAADPAALVGETQLRTRFRNADNRSVQAPW